MNWLRKTITRYYLRRYQVPRDLVRDAFDRYADRPALQTSRGRLSFQQLADRVYSLSHALERQGLQPGDRLFTMVPDGWEQVEARLAAFESNFVITSFHRSHPTQFVKQAADIAQPRAFIVDPSLGSSIADDLKRELPDVFILTTGPEGSYERALAATHARKSSHPIAADDPASLGFTSGTTGKPKALFTNHGVIVTSLKLTATNVAVQRGEADRFLLGIPLVGAGSGVVMPMLFSGALQIIPRQYSADHLLDMIETFDVTRTFITPSLLIDLLDHPRADLSSLRNVIYGTAPMPVPKIEEAIRRWGPIFQQGYGMAEVLPPVSLLQMHQHGTSQQPAPRRILRSVGQVVPEVEVKIIDGAGQPLPAGEVGQILIKSPTRFSGYWRDPETTARVLQNGWYHSGDLGFLSTDSFLTVLGRRADVIETGRGQVFPLLVEEVAHDHPGVKEAALVEPIADQTHLVVSTRRAWEQAARRVQLEQELQGMFLHGTNGIQPPDSMEIVQELPRSYLAKVLRRQVQSSNGPQPAHNERNV